MPSVEQSSSKTMPLPPALERYFEISLYLLVLTGFATLAATGGLDLPTVVFVTAALLFRGSVLFRGNSLAIPETWTNFLTVAYVGFYALDYWAISRGFLRATIHLVLFVMVVRLFSLRRDRDLYFLSVISFLMVLAAALLTVDSAFLLGFAAFLLTAVATFILMEIGSAFRLAELHAKGSADQPASRRMVASLAGAAPVIVLLILLAAGAIFFVLPRASAGYLSSYAFRDELSTGFNERVELGQIGEIQQSNLVVMHIQIDGDAEGRFRQLLWKGIALSNFDGRGWSNPNRQHAVPRRGDGSFALASADSHSSFSQPQPVASHLIHYAVLMQPVGGNLFFLAPTARSLQGSYRSVVMDDGGAVFDVDGYHPINRYEAWSDIGQPDADLLRVASGPYPAEVVHDGLQLPVLDSRIPRLAQRLTSTASNNYEKALAIQNYLRTSFGYTLQLSRTPPRDPLAEFLFVRREGHCEYFASAMAVMLRTLGIPTRVVNGFRTDEFNDLTEQYVIRDSNAHSWVEVYFPVYGWVEFDPTPAAPAQAHTTWSRLALYLDAAQSFWREWIVNYDVRHQLALGEQATTFGRDRMLRWQSSVRRFYRRLLHRAASMQFAFADAPGRWGLLVACAAILLVLAGLGPALWRAIRRQWRVARVQKSPRGAAEVWYQRMTRVTARRGWPKAPTQTPAEFVESIGDQELRQHVAQFTLHYEWARFGYSTGDAERLPELYGNLKRR